MKWIIQTAVFAELMPPSFLGDGKILRVEPAKCSSETLGETSTAPEKPGSAYLIKVMFGLMKISLKIRFSQLRKSTKNKTTVFQFE